MAYELDDFCEDCKDLIDPATGKKDLEAVRKILEKLCHNQEFLDANCGPGAVHGVFRRRRRRQWPRAGAPH